MDLLLGAVPKTPASVDEPAPVLATPQAGHTPMALLEKTGEMALASTNDSIDFDELDSTETSASSVEPLAEVSAEPAESPASELPVGEIIAVEAPSDRAAKPVVAAKPGITSEPPAPKAQRRRSQAPPPAAVTTTVAPVVETSAVLLPAAAQPKAAPAAGRRRRDPDEDLEPAYVPIKITVSIPAVVLSELIRTVHTIRRMTGQRQPVNQGSVIAAALEMAFEEFHTKGATSQLVDRLREE